MADPASEKNNRALWRLDICRLLIKERKRIGLHLGFELCPVPAWDILLDLYVAHQERQFVQIWSLCVASNIPTSTAHRKIGEMVEAGILVRRNDGGRVIVGLSEAYVSKLDALFEDLAAFLAPAGNGDARSFAGPWSGATEGTVGFHDGKLQR